jgi:hypothetical protein
MNDPLGAPHWFKMITTENWLRPDVPLFFLFSADSWVQAHLPPRLDGSVPSEVALLSEAACRMMLWSG